MSDVPQTVKDAVLKTSVKPAYLDTGVKGFDWKNGVDYDGILNSYLTTGLQATNFGLAVQEINKMIEAKKQPLPEEKYEDADDVYTQIKSSCTIFLGYTSNIVSSGLRETIKFLVQHKLVLNNN